MDINERNQLTRLLNNSIRNKIHASNLYFAGNEVDKINIYQLGLYYPLIIFNAVEIFFVFILAFMLNDS